jgi:hypothetical protein
MAEGDRRPAIRRGSSLGRWIVVGIAVFRDDAFEPEFAGMRKDFSAVTFEVLVVLDSGRCFGEQPRKRGLPLFEGPWPPVLAVEFEQIESIK